MRCLDSRRHRARTQKYSPPPALWAERIAKIQPSLLLDAEGAGAAAASETSVAPEPEPDRRRAPPCSGATPIADAVVVVVVVVGPSELTMHSSSTSSEMVTRCSASCCAVDLRHVSILSLTMVVGLGVESREKSYWVGLVLGLKCHRSFSSFPLVPNH